MNALINASTDQLAIKPVIVGSESINTVNARELHEFLGVGRDFSNWIKGRINEYGFVEGVDYTTVQNLRSPKRATSKSRPQMATDYLVSVDMAKELAMVERTEKGRQVRRYFIECEKALQFKHNDLFLQIARHEALLTDATDRASNAGRELRFQGRVVKPALRSRIQELIKELQPELLGLEEVA